LKMIIGLCYDLRTWYLERGFSWEETAEFDKEDTIEGIENALLELGFKTERIGNVFQLVERLASGSRWDLVFNICEGMIGPSRESVVPALLDQYRIPYVFSNGEVLGISLNKHLAKQVVATRGVPVVPGIVVNAPEDVDQIRLEYPLFVKPLSEGTGKGIHGKSKVDHPSQLAGAVEYVLNKIRQPALVEEYMPGREFTAGVTGSGNSARFAGAMEIITLEGQIYSMDVKENYEQLARYRKVDEEMAERCADIALRAWNALGAVDGGRIDLRTDKTGRLCFMEANPLAGLHPVHSDLPIIARMNGTSYVQLIGMIMESALTRLKRIP
jgi:D-alanine-D-alanine ligase